MSGNTAMNGNLLTLAIVAIVVVRFLMRELRTRVVRASSLWIRPGILVLLTAFVAFTSFSLPSSDTALTVLALCGGAVAGAITGALVVRSTSFAPANEPAAVRARGSFATVAIWLIALLLRFAVRYVLSPADPHSAAGQAQFFALNSGLVALVAAAFVVVALGFHRAIARLAGTAQAASR